MDRNYRALEERIGHLEVELEMNRNQDEIAPCLRMHPSRYQQIVQKRKNNVSRRLGWPNNY